MTKSNAPSTMSFLDYLKEKKRDEYGFPLMELEEWSRLRSQLIRKKILKVHSDKKKTTFNQSAIKKAIGKLKEKVARFKQLDKDYPESLKVFATINFLFSLEREVWDDYLRPKLAKPTGNAKSDFENNILIEKNQLHLGNLRRAFEDMISADQLRKQLIDQGVDSKQIDTLLSHSVKRSYMKIVSMRQ